MLPQSLAFGPWAHVRVSGSMSSIAWTEAMSHATVEQTGVVRPHLIGGVSFPFAACWDQASQVAPVIKNLSASAGDAGDSSLIPGSERSPGGGHGNPLQYSCLENLVDRGAWGYVSTDLRFLNVEF